MTNTIPTPAHFIIQLHGTRDGWPNEMTPDEERIMGEHFEYLRALTHDGKVLLAGPCMDPIYGLVVLEVSGEDEARQIMADEPSVVGGVHTYTMHPFRASLLNGRNNLPQTTTDKAIRKEIVVDESRDRAWHAWTTTEGIKSFFAPDARIELKIGGRYEMYFLPEDSPLGKRGGEGCRILSYLPREMLSFTWNAPPQFPLVREMRTHVIVQFADVGEKQTKVTLTDIGWGEGDGWAQVYDYFDSAWGHVLESLQNNCADGTVAASCCD